MENKQRKRIKKPRTTAKIRKDHERDVEQKKIIRFQFNSYRTGGRKRERQKIDSSSERWSLCGFNFVLLNFPFFSLCCFIHFVDPSLKLFRIAENCAAVNNYTEYTRIYELQETDEKVPYANKFVVIRALCKH